MYPYDPNHDYVSDYIDQWNRQIRATKIWMAVIGIVLVITGLASAIAPFSMYAFIQTFAAVALIMHGASHLVSYFQTPQFFRNGATLASGLLNALLGILLLALPATLTAGTIVFLLAFLLVTMGIERISFAQNMKYYQLGGSTAGMITGIVDIVLGIVFALMPLFASAAISILISAYLVVAGVALIVESLSIKRIDR
ncbi:HdeD family acid-resistance protein [Enorma sp.]|mgnify:CR=1 FL=1|jgi:uncharacterized membrane protein HdeD (DUF308 family)|uniref:HdeD family acid-resistance protein n=1 Tax=Enorma sp. TaxID=1920692 RepID=UPI0025E662BA|nr:DUF308 domain-containing protein [uncultured Enorma sp.]